MNVVCMSYLDSSVKTLPAVVKTVSTLVEFYCVDWLNTTVVNVYLLDLYSESGFVIDMHSVRGAVG